MDLVAGSWRTLPLMVQKRSDAGLRYQIQEEAFKANLCNLCKLISEYRAQVCFAYES